MALIYYTGQDVGLTASPLMDSGAPVTGSVSASVAITDPSGTVTTPAVSGPVTGAFTAVVPAVSVAGVWLVRWTVTGAGIGWTSETQFSVRPTGIEQMVDLASVKAHLNIPPTDTRQDDELQGFILAAADMARDHCGPFLPEQHTQWFDGGVSNLVPDWLPLISVQSVTEFYGVVSYVLTEQPLSSPVSQFAYTVDYQSGAITRRSFSGTAGMFAGGEKNIKVVYTAGRTSIPYTVRLGCLELIRHMYQLTQQAGRPKFGSAGYDGSDAPIPTGFALPNRVLQLWGGFRRPPGIA